MITSNQKLITGSFMLFITKDEDSYHSYIAHNDDEDYFSKTLDASQAEKIFNNISDPIDHEKKSNKAKLMVEDQSGGQVCIDWYLTTTWYDENGGIVFQSEAYMYSTCIDNSSGSGVGGKQQLIPEEFIIDFGEPISADLGHGSESEEVLSVDTFKIATLTWKFHNALTWSYKSVEKGYVKVSHGIRTWSKLNHIEIYPQGNITYGDFELLKSALTPYVNVSDASMMADYQIKIITDVHGVKNTNYSGKMNTMATWDTYFVKIN